MASVTAGGPGLVAVGQDRSEGEDADAAVWTSVDGLSWSRVPHDEAVFGGDGGREMSSVVAGGPGLVAVGQEGVNSQGYTGAGSAMVWTSVDGLSWSRIPDDEVVLHEAGEQGMTSVTVGGPGLVAVGFEWLGGGDWHAAAWASVDGMSWSRVPHDEAVFGGEGAQFMHSVSAGGPGLVAVGFVPLHGMWQGRSPPMSTRTRSFFALPRKSSRHSAIRPTVRLGS